MAQFRARGNWWSVPDCRKSVLAQGDDTEMTISSQHSASEAFAIEGAERPSRWLVTVDHATNRVPGWVGGGSLGLPGEEMARHIAFDPGALGTGRGIAERLNAPLIHSDFSRLVIDPNRGEDDPTLVMQLYDGTVIPGNRAVDAAETETRLSRLHRPYHDALETLAAARPDRAICAIHSFTPQLRGKPPRPWEIGVLSSHKDRRLSEPFIARLRALGIVTGDNEPYAGHLDGDSIDRHALAPRRPNLLIEVRNDLIATPEGEAAWAARLAPVLDAVLSDSGL